MTLLPEQWGQIYLGEVTALKTGPFGSALHKSDYRTGGIPIVNPMHILNGKIVPSSAATITPEKAETLSEFRLQRGDVVLGRRGEMGRCAVVGEAEHGWLCGTGSLIVRPSTALDPHYLQRFLSSPAVVSRLEEASVGSTMVNLNQRILLELEVPISPLAEQKRIADKLDAVLVRVDACRERLDRVPAILKRFRQAVLAAATSGKLTDGWREHTRIDIGTWEQMSLGNLVLDSANGLAKRRGEVGIETIVLRLADFRNSERVFGNERSIKLEPKETQKYSLKTGDLLVVRVNGSRDLAGKFITYLAPYESTEAYCDHFIRLRLDKQRVEPAYALFVANSGLGREYIEGELVTSAGQNTINQTSLFGLDVPLPSLPEQHEIVRRVEALFAYADRLEARYTTARAQVERLTPALLAKAFRGELVPQDPNDEPATELLDRIRAARAEQPTAKRGRKLPVTRVPRVPREKAAMTKSRLDDDVHHKPYLAGLLREAGGITSVEDLFRRAELPVTDFYKQLAWEVENGHIRDDETRLEAA